MTKNLKIAVFSLSAVALGLSAFSYMKQPKGKIIINSDGSGSVSLGNKTQTFGPLETGIVKSWNNYTLSASKDKMQLTQGKTILEEGVMTKYDQGTSRVEIDNNFNYEKQVKIDKATNLVLSSFTPQNPILNLFKNP